ncbi:MAG: glutamate--tRNA ligase [Candidatus Nitrospinota bacterium M3_3B_026]
MTAPRTRFAPSPTGSLHVGNLRTALFNWLYAKGRGGSFILRIEDTDRERSDPEAEQGIIATLKRLGLDWDEGPDIGGPHGPYRQSGRREKYENAARTLLDRGAAYPCYCSVEELEKLRLAQIAAGQPPRYTGECARLTEKERDELSRKKGPPAWRFRAGTGSVEFHDGVRGYVSFEAEDMGDFIIARSDGSAAYYLASIVDDLDMGVTDVIRGEDHLANTPKQILIARALGGEPPRYHHLSLVLDEKGRKFSKRVESLNIARLLDSGYLPSAINTAVAMLGWSGVEGDGPESLEEMAARFDIAKVSRAPCHFDMARLDHINSRALKTLDAAGFLEALRPPLEKAGFPFEKFSDNDLLKMAEALRDSVHEPKQAVDYASQFAGSGAPDSGAAKALSGALEIIEAAREAVGRVPALDEDSFDGVIEFIFSATAAPKGKIYKPLRAAVTGRTKGPALADIFSALGRDEVLRRLDERISGLR